MTVLLVTFILSQNIGGPSVHFFYRPSCGHCMDILLADIPRLRAKYVFTLKEYDIDLLSNYELLERMEEDHGTTGEDLPVVFVGDSVFYGPEEMYVRMDGVLRSMTSKPERESRKPEPQGDTLLFFPAWL
jgi:glutaredoxin